MKRTKTLVTIGSVALLLAAATAFAEDGPLVEEVAVRNRLYTAGHRWEVGGHFGFVLLSRLTEHFNLNASVAYNFHDWLGVELRGGYAISQHTTLARQIRNDFATNPSISQASDLSDLWEMRANAVAGLRFQPVYGKINLMAELPVHFQLYAWAGAGAGLFRFESLTICPNKSGDGTCAGYYTAQQFSPLVSLALGFRFFLNEHHGFKLELRDYSFLDSYYINVKRADSSPSIPTAGGSLSPDAGITSLVMLDLGYSFMF